MDPHRSRSPWRELRLSTRVAADRIPVVRYKRLEEIRDPIWLSPPAKREWFSAPSVPALLLHKWRSY